MREASTDGDLARWSARWLDASPQSMMNGPPTEEQQPLTADNEVALKL
jgi:hypothetical protein